MERVRRGTSELRSRNVKASRRPGRKTFLVIHPSTGTGQAKNVNYGSAVQPERPHAPPFPFHAESCKIWHRPSSFLFFFQFLNLYQLAFSNGKIFQISKYKNFKNRVLIDFNNRGIIMIMMWICDVWKKKYWILDINNELMFEIRMFNYQWNNFIVN